MLWISLFLNFAEFVIESTTTVSSFFNTPLSAICSKLATPRSLPFFSQFSPSRYFSWITCSCFSKHEQGEKRGQRHRFLWERVADILRGVRSSGISKLDSSSEQILLFETCTFSDNLASLFFIVKSYLSEVFIWYFFENDFWLIFTKCQK